MRIWLSAAVAACVFVLAMAGIASASNDHGHGHGKPDLPLIDTSNAANCDFIAEPGNPLCMLPFPDDYYTRRRRRQPDRAPHRLDRRRDAGQRAGRHSTPTPYNASRRLQPGPVDRAQGPGDLDTAGGVRATDAVPINHLGRYRSPTRRSSSSTRRPGERWPIWVEIDSNATEPGQGRAEIHPAVNFASGHRYIVALRDLKRRRPGDPGAAGFRYYRDDVPSTQRRSTRRASTSSDSSRRCARRGIRRSSLYLAWDFTVASDENNAGRELTMRDDAFAHARRHDLADVTVQGTSPAFTVDKVEDLPQSRTEDRPPRQRATTWCPATCSRLRARAARFVLGRRRRARARTAIWTGQLRLHHPRVGDRRADAGPARPSLYGHGLFGDAAEVASGPQRRSRPGRTASSSARPTRSGCLEPTSRHAAGILAGPLATSRSSPTACSRACSTSSSSAGR